MNFDKQRISALMRLVTGFLEKLSVASLAVGLFQNVTTSYVLGLAFIAGASLLTCLEVDK